MKRFVIILIIAAMFAAISTAISAPSKFEGKIVRKIEFKGLKNFSADELAYKMVTAEGFPLKAVEVRKDIKTIFDTGKLEDVSVEIEEFQDGVRLRFICTERPVVDAIIYKGVRELNETDLGEVVLLKQGEPFRKDLAERSISLMREKYIGKGLFNASLSYKVKKAKRDKDVIVEFIVDEGEEIKVAKINILGAVHVYEKEIKAIMETKENGIFSDGIFDRDKYEQDKGRIIGYCKQSGYLDASIIGDKVEYEWANPLTKTKRVIYITIAISEGEKYYFDSYSVSIETDGNKSVFTPEQLAKTFTQTKKGEVFNNTMFEADRQMINFTYASEGYIFARVVPQRTVTERIVEVDGKKEKRKFVSVHFSVVEGTKAYIESIIIKGNKKTLDNVIRREMACKEGELFDSRKIQISREKIYNLGFFKEVNIDIRPGSKDGYMNLIVDVQEQPSATISVGGGYGTSSGFSIFAEVAEKNFRGRGQNLGARFEYGPLRSAITLSFTEPWLLEKYPLALSASLFYNLYTIETSSMFSSSEIATYKKMGFGYSIGLSYRFFYNYVVGTAWIHEFKKYLEPSGNNSDAIFIAASQGLQDKRTQRFYIYRDSKDNYLNPTSGSRIGIGLNITGGILGGDDHFLRWSPEAAIYWSPFHLPFLRDWRCVFEFRANATFLTKPIGKVRQNPERNEWLESEDRLLIGGPETVRGWDYYDSELPDSWSSSGLFHRILYGAEFRVPIHPQMLWVAFFFDAGALFSDNSWEKQMDPDSLFYQEIRKDREKKELYSINEFMSGDVNPIKYFKYGYGFGFRIQIPMMPLRFWFGKKAMFQNGHFKNMEGIQFQFQIGDYRY